MMIHDNGDGPRIQGPAHLRTRMRPGGGDDAQSAGEEQSWPGRLHAHPNPPALDGCRNPAKLGLPGPPPPPRARAAMDFVSGPETRQSPGADSPAPPEHLFGWA